MARPNKSMRQIKEILRLKYQHQLSVRAIARSCGLSRSTVGDYLQRAKAAGLNWPLPEELSEAQLLELERRAQSDNYRGVWQGGPESYLAGEKVTHDGSLWLALKNNAGVKPGTPRGSPSWRLIVKRGAAGE